MSKRSSWRGSRGSRGSPYTIRGTKRGEGEEAHPPTPPSPRGELLLELKQEDISRSPYDPKISDCNCVASYSWLDGETPTMIIPGKPPAWTPPAVNRRLDPDKGKFFRDPHAARYPTFPVEPAVQAVLKQRPQLSTKDIDIFTCNSALGNLGRYVRGAEREFRIILVRVGSTVFFIRRENSPTELIPDVRGYGHTFPEEYTSWEKDVKSSGSHQRIIQYSFGGLRLLVRFEADGYFRQKVEGSDLQLEASSLVDTFDSASVGQTRATSQKCLLIKEGSQLISQENIFDIKTRSMFDFKTRTIKKEIDVTDIIPRLWTSQNPTLIVEFHDRGLFEDIRVQDVRQEIKEWEANNAETLGQLASLLHELVEFARASKTNLEVCRSESGPLEIRRLADEALEALPSDLKARWVGQPEGNEEASPQDRDSSSSDEGFSEEVSWDADPFAHYSDDESPIDFTACSADHCGFCGHCPHQIACPAPRSQKIKSKMKSFQVAYVIHSIAICGRILALTCPNPRRELCRL